MSQIQTPPEIDAWTEALTKKQRRIVQALRESVHLVAPHLCEHLRAEGLCYSGRERVLYIEPLPDGVRLCFYEGARLADPEGLLRGSGSELRRLDLDTPEAAGHEGIRQLVEAAARFDANM